MGVKYLKKDSLATLKSNIGNILEHYKSPSPWLHDFFGDDSYWSDAEITLPEDIDLKLPDDGESNDLENVKRVFGPMKHLTRLQACDERLWAYLTHVSCWKYMRIRWPIEGKHPDGFRESPDAFVRQRYFFMPNRDRALVRNGLARLWWYGYVSYDSDRDNPYELTELLLHTLDITQSILERSFSRNESIAKAVLSALSTWKNERNTLPKREPFRRTMRDLTLLGGVTILDSLQFKEIERLVLQRLDFNIQEAAS